MDPVLNLLHEHAEISLMLKILETIKDRLKAGKQISREDLKRVTGFLSGFADKCHHGKEEKLFFPMLQGKMTLAEEDEVESFIREHKTGRRCVLEMKKAIEQSPPVDFIDNAERYIILLIDYIRRENAIFVGLGKKLSESEILSFGKEFEGVEIEGIGRDKLDEHRQTLRELKGVFI